MGGTPMAPHIWQPWLHITQHSIIILHIRQHSIIIYSDQFSKCAYKCHASNDTDPNHVCFSGDIRQKLWCKHKKNKHFEHCKRLCQGFGLTYIRSKKNIWLQLVLMLSDQQITTPACFQRDCWIFCLEFCKTRMAFRVVRQRREARRIAKLDEIFQVYEIIRVENLSNVQHIWYKVWQEGLNRKQNIYLYYTCQ